jgi:hypothetical protein
MKQRATAAPPEEKPRRGRPFPPGISGNPEGLRVRGRRFGQLYDDIAASFGGVSDLSPFQKILLRQGVRLLVKAEKEKDPDLAVRLSNACMRALAGMQHGGLNVRKAPPKPPAKSQTFDQYLAHGDLARGGDTP